VHAVRTARDADGRFMSVPLHVIGRASRPCHPCTLSRGWRVSKVAAGGHLQMAGAEMRKWAQPDCIGDDRVMRTYKYALCAAALAAVCSPAVVRSTSQNTLKHR
jgi:hypothetical protein